MRAAVGLGIALACCACGEESRVCARTPVDALTVDSPRAVAPVEDSFPKAFAASQAEDAYHFERARHIDLGYIGDSPIGTEPTPPHVDPPWEQPFTLDRPYACSACRRSCPIVYVVPVLSQ